MKRMLCIILATSLASASCVRDEVEVDKTHLYNGYIAHYLHASGDIAAEPETNKDGETIIDIRLSSSKELDEERSRAIADSIGDTLSYSYYCRAYDTKVMVDRVEGIDISADRNFDHRHPTGTSLTEYFDIEMQDNFAFVKNKYKVPEEAFYTGHDLERIEVSAYAKYDGPMQRVKWQDMKLSPTNFRLKLKTQPDSTRAYTFTITLKMEGRMHSIAQTEPILIKGRE